jgi:hypothetical protein
MARGRTALLALLALAASMLSACNIVVTKTPLFADADKSPLQFRDGVWNPADTDCAFDETKPVDAWPDCVKPVLVRNGEFLSWQGDTKSWKSDDTGKALIVAGDPMILQLYDKPENADPFYLYAALTPKLDAQGRIISLQAWPVLCGPPPPPPPGGKADASALTQAGTKQPFPGMTMDAQGQNCTTGDPKALRNAARASKALVKDGLPSIHWVRDGER